MQAQQNPPKKRATVGTMTVEVRVGRFTVPATRYTARIGRDALMRKDGKPRTFLTYESAMRAAQRHIDDQSN